MRGFANNGTDTMINTEEVDEAVEEGIKVAASFAVDECVAEHVDTQSSCEDEEMDAILSYYLRGGRLENGQRVGL